jgi:hypothetical protein
VKEEEESWAQAGGFEAGEAWKPQNESSQRFSVAHFADAMNSFWSEGRLKLGWEYIGKWSIRQQSNAQNFFHSTFFRRN